MEPPAPTGLIKQKVPQNTKVPPQMVLFCDSGLYTLHLHRILQEANNKRHRFNGCVETKERKLQTMEQVQKGLRRSWERCARKRKEESVSYGFCYSFLSHLSSHVSLSLSPYAFSFIPNSVKSIKRHSQPMRLLELVCPSAWISFLEVYI